MEQKADFLRKEYTEILTRLDEHAPRKWGKMNVRQMIEHMSEYVSIANGKAPIEIITAEDMIPRMQAFLASEKPMRENTPNVLMPDTPAPVKHATKQDAINELQSELDHFFTVHEQDPNRKTANPFFGMLDYEHQVRLLHKHATHHLRQFGLDY